MENGLIPGADFFSDNSSDSEWEDNVRDFVRKFRPSQRVGSENSSQKINSQSGSTRRGRSRERSTIASLPIFPKSSVPEPGLTIEDGQENDRHVSVSLEGQSKGPNRARQMYLRRLNKDTVRVVHTGSIVNTPRHSIMDSHSETASPVEQREPPFSFPALKQGEDVHTPLPLSPTFQSRHRRNTPESMIADSIINAHVMTMRALGSLNLSPTETSHPHGMTYLQSPTTTDFHRSFSFPNSQRVTASSTLSVNSERSTYQSSNFFRMPHAFTTKRSSKSRSRPRESSTYPGLEGRDDEEYARLESAMGGEELRTPYDDRKGKHVLGIVAQEGRLDLRSRLERNESAQGVVKSYAGSGSESAERVVWLSLKRRGWRKGNGDATKKPMVCIVVQSAPTLGSLSRIEKIPTSKKNPVDFDDERFAEELRSGHRRLVGSWFRRAFSARELHNIQLSQHSMWSGTPAQTVPPTVEGLLAVGNGSDSSGDPGTPFTEEGLTSLFSQPRIGKARYTWVHWARRVAASNSHRTSHPYHPAHASSLIGGKMSPSTITTIEFLHAPSSFRILFALALVLLGSITAALMWIFFGTTGKETSEDLVRQRSDRVGSGMAVGVLTLLLESVGFGAWVVLS